jgi:hypothetical protein
LPDFCATLTRTLDRTRTQLQEWLQARKLAVRVRGRGDRRRYARLQFTVECRIPALTLVTQDGWQPARSERGGRRRVHTARPRKSA